MPRYLFPVAIMSTTFLKAVCSLPYISVMCCGEEGKRGRGGREREGKKEIKRRGRAGKGGKWRRVERRRGGQNSEEWRRKGQI